MAQHAGYRPDREKLLKSKLSSEDEDYTFWLSKETKKDKSAIEWKGSITVLTLNRPVGGGGAESAQRLVLPSAVLKQSAVGS